MESVDERPLPGGPLALDLLNTTWAAGGETIDWLDRDGAVQRFTSSWDHTVTDDRTDETRSALIEARELTRRVFTSADAGRIADDLMAEVNAVLGHGTAAVIATPDGPKLTISSDDPARALAVESIVSAVDLLSERSERIRACEHDDCLLWFLDTSKAGRRRWCSMERCGNRTKARRHYERTGKPNRSD